MAVLLAAVVLGTPAAALRVACAGRSCDRPAQAETEVPFCSLPGAVRSRIEAGFREGRSPDVLAVTGSDRVAGTVQPPGAGDLRFGPATVWPSVRDHSSWRVPILFAGTGVSDGATIPDGARLADIAPTVARVLGLDRPHPEVRSGTALDAVTREERPRLVLMVVWKGVGSDGLEADSGAWPNLEGLLESGAGTLEGDVGSLPVDPTAVLTTIGTGGLPSEHGITGSLLRGEDGGVVRAWTDRAPISVIASLGDDLDRAFGEDPLVGLVGTDRADRGATGGSWYLDADRDDSVFVAGPVRGQERAALELLGTGYGDDVVADLLVVAMNGPVARLDQALGRLQAAAEAAAGGSLLTVVTGTGQARPPPGAARVHASGLVDGLDGAIGATGEVVQAAVPGGLFLDQAVLADEGIATDRVVRALGGVGGPSGRPLAAEAFPAIAVTLAGYC